MHGAADGARGHRPDWSDLGNGAPVPNRHSISSKRLILIGFWLLLGSTFLWNLIQLGRLTVALASTVVPIDGVAAHNGFVPLFLVFLLTSAIEAILGAGLYQVTRNYLRQKSGDPREDRS